jgi:predicted lipoprotein with Yx(FWY)xxD motif
MAGRLTLHRQGGRSGRRIGRVGGAFVAIAALVGLQAVPAAMAGPAQHPIPSNAVVVSSRQSALGRILINSSGFSLYDFSGDAAPTSPVTACIPANTAPTGLPCTTVWKPLLASGPLVAGPGVKAKGLGQLTRGAINQVTYFGQPLYTFLNDTAPGQINGQDITSFHGFWRLMSVDGKPAADRAAVSLELSVDGPVLKTTTAGATPRTLYNLTSDPPGGTACTAACTAFWPPLLTDRMPTAGPGVNRNALGLLHRPEGTLQVTYFGEPIYLYAFDLGAGQPGGQVNGNDNIDSNAKGVWYTLASDGMSNAGPVPVEAETAGAKSLVAASAVSSGGTTATLYAFSIDTATAAQCTGACARAWPPLLTTAPPVAGPGTTPALVGAIQRADGSFQVTYAGPPLYLFSQALNPTTAGEGITAFGGTFNVITVAGAVS